MGEREWSDRSSQLRLGRPPREVGRTEEFFLTLIYFELEEDYSGTLPAGGRRLSITRGEVATRALATRPLVDAEARCASVSVQSVNRRGFDGVSGRRLPDLSRPVMSAVAGW
jgi:hypothetical protein